MSYQMERNSKKSILFKLHDQIMGSHCAPMFTHNIFKSNSVEGFFHVQEIVFALFHD